jgi:glycosyltransferase involved in cell wall biosynthesis
MRRKILHVVGGMTRGGVETWLMHVLRNIDPGEFELHFLVASEREMAYDQEILALGGHLHRGARSRHPMRYAEQFRELNHRCGPFAALHSHVYWYSGFVSRLAYRAGIPVRIAHSHSASRTAAWKLHRRTYQLLMRSMIMRYATHRVAASRRAAQALFGRHPKKAARLLYCGMDFTPFSRRATVPESKTRLGIDPGCKVIGHVGRFVTVKNHAFAIDVFGRTIARGTDAHLLLVGDGPLLPALRAQVERCGLGGRCTFAGAQSELVRFYSAMDLFLFPSVWEGLGLAAVEAQAAGVPVLASEGVPEDVDVIPGLVERMALSSGVDTWASAANRRLAQPSPARGDEAALVQQSRFGLPACLDALCRIYRGESFDDSVQ